MKMTVLVERLDEEKYRASTGYPLVIESEGKSRDEAVERLRKRALERLERSELVQVSIADDRNINPWVKYAGLWKDHPDFEAFLENIAEYRQTGDDVRSTR